MIPRRTRQGYTIDELQAGALSSEDDEESEDELAEDGEVNMDVSNVRQEQQDGSKFEDYDVEDQVDEENEAWVKTHFEQGASVEKCTLCCPGCFTPVSYVALPENAQTWTTDKVVNCLIKPVSQNLESVVCAVCGTAIGTRSAITGRYVLRTVLPGSSRVDDI